MIPSGSPRSPANMAIVPSLYSVPSLILHFSSALLRSAIRDNTPCALAASQSENGPERSEDEKLRVGFARSIRCCQQVARGHKNKGEATGKYK